MMQTAAMRGDRGELSDWEHFVTDVPWLLQGGRQAVAGEPAPADAGLDVDRFPKLVRLVAAATATPVAIDGEDRVLLTWRAGSGDRLSWLCLPPTEGGSTIHPDHRALLRGFGGIVECGGDDRGSWLLNCNDALTAREAEHDASFISYADWMLEDDGGTWPIVLEDYYSICREANGNDTLCHRRDGDVLMFAADHAFDHLEVLDGCPPHSLYRIVGAPRFVDWVEEVASQWLDMLTPLSR